MNFAAQNKLHREERVYSFTFLKIMVHCIQFKDALPDDHHCREERLGWIRFFNGAHSLYVNERHFRAHHEMISKDMISHLPANKGVVIDYGCGDAINADCVAAHCKTLILVEASERLRTRLLERYAHHPVIQILSPNDCLTLEPASVDVVIIHSVLQYLRWEETGTLIGQMGRLIKPHGSILLGDIVPPNRTMIQDVLALLMFAWRGQFLFAGLFGLVTTFFSHYRTLRKRYGLTCYSAQDIHQMARKNGLFTRALRRNIGHDQSRNMYQLRLQ